jgi:hypothetical protein
MLSYPLSALSPDRNLMLPETINGMVPITGFFKANRKSNQMERKRILARQCRKKQMAKVEKLRDSIFNLDFENKRLRSLAASLLPPSIAARVLNECHCPDSVHDYLTSETVYEW